MITAVSPDYRQMRRRVATASGVTPTTENPLKKRLRAELHGGPPVTATASPLAQPGMTMPPAAPAPPAPQVSPSPLQGRTGGAPAGSGFYGQDALTGALGGKKANAKGVRKLMMRTSGANAVMAQQPMWDSIHQLMEQ